MSDRTTEKMLKNLQDATKTADLDLDSVPWMSRPGFETAKREAKDSLPGLLAEYCARIFENAILLFPIGRDDQKSRHFAEISGEAGGTFTADAQGIYEMLAQRVEPTLGQRREFTAQQFVTLNDAIDDLTRSAPVATQNLTLPPAALKTVDAAPTFEALVSLIRDLVEGVHGKALVKLYVTKVVCDQALKEEFDAKTLAAVVLNTTVETREALGAGVRSALVDVEGAAEIDKAFAITIFKEASKLKKA